MFKDTTNQDYSLQPCSPGIDAGDSTVIKQFNILTDYLNRPRIVGSNVDIGPYELPGMTAGANPQIQGACAGASVGSVAFSPENACVPLAYNWASGLATGSGTSNLAPGQYVFTITDSRNRQAVDTVLVPTLPPPNLSPETLPVICGDTLGGSATAQVSGGQPPYAFNWQDQNADSLRTGLAAGTYALTVTDAKNCTSTTSVKVETSGTLDIGFQIQQPTCNGLADGQIEAQPANGKAPFIYKWENASPENPRDSLAAGSYELSVTDAFGCLSQWTLALPEPGAIQVFASVQNASASTASDGKITLDSITGGTEPFTWLWDDGTSGPAAQNLAPGNHSVAVTDANGCEQVASFFVDFTDAVGDPGSGESAFRVFPNPNAGRFALFSNESGATWKINALPGNELARGEARKGETRLDLSGLPDGVYLLTVSGKQTRVFRIAVQK